MALSACGPATSTTPATVTIAALRATAHEGKDVVLEGLVTYAAPERGVAFVQDATGGIPVEIGPDDAALATGRHVVFTARVERLHALARLTRPRVLSTRPSALPDPPLADPEAVADGTLNSTRIKLVARVQAATRVGTGLSLTLTSRGQELVGHLREAGTLGAHDLIGAEVRLRGVVEPGEGTADHVPGLRLLAGTAARRRDCPARRAAIVARPEASADLSGTRYQSSRPAAPHGDSLCACAAASPTWIESGPCYSSRTTPPASSSIPLS